MHSIVNVCNQIIKSYTENGVDLWYVICISIKPPVFRKVKLVCKRKRES